MAAIEPNRALVRYRITTSLEPDAASAAAAILSRSERDRCARFRFEHDRRDYALAHALLRTTLSSCYPAAPEEWEFEVDAFGKPSVAGALGRALSPRFSLSHTLGLVACIVADRVDVGIDAASLSQHTDMDGIARRLFSPDELAYVAAAAHHGERRARFFEIWTLKEAFAKAVGRGLDLPLSDVAFGLLTDRGISVVPPSRWDTGRWHCELFAAGTTHRLAVVLGGASASPIGLVDVTSDGDPALHRLRSSSESGRRSSEHL